jgi:GNAT superfamily N-acetyltransferase
MARERADIRTASPADMQLMVGWARDEGWNPGLSDALAFHSADPEGFLISWIGDEPIGCISAVRYGADFGFLGFYIVRPAWRGRDYGIELWNAAMAHLDGRSVGLDGVPAQQPNYRKSGFALAWRNARFSLPAADQTRMKLPTTDAVEPVTPADIAALDGRVFPTHRQAFWEAWAASPGHVTAGLRMDGRLVGAGMLRPCHAGSKIAPLYAEDRSAATTIVAALLQAAPPGPVYLDVPMRHDAAVAMALGLGMIPVFETARMYRGPAPACDHDLLFGVASFELG